MALALVGLALWWFLARMKERLGAPDTAFAWLIVFFVSLHAMLEWPLALLYFSIPAAVLFGTAEPRLRRPAVQFSARIVGLAGVAGLLLCLPMKLEFDDLADVLARAEAQRSALHTVDEDTLRRLLALSESARFRLLAELYLVTIRNPGSVAATSDEIARHERVLIRGGEPPIIARLIILLAKAGRLDESVRHAQRLNVFETDRQTDYRGTILDAIKHIGPEADALRATLNQGPASPRPAGS